MYIYQNYISLGYFCEVAEDLEQLGLRNISSPFDWNISDFEGVIEAIGTRFRSFMDYDNLIQNARNRSQYLDEKYKIFFFHDFSKYQSLEKQYDKVKGKYERRIARFLKSIESPTIFFRYISNEIKNPDGRSQELEWIEYNQNYINMVIQSYNKENKIIYIGDEETSSDSIEIYHVKKDSDDVVSRHPIINNTKLFPLVENMSVIGQKENIVRYRKKKKKQNTFCFKLGNCLKNIYCKYFLEEYVHAREYDILGK